MGVCVLKYSDTKCYISFRGFNFLIIICDTVIQYEIQISFLSLAPGIELLTETGGICRVAE